VKIPSLPVALDSPWYLGLLVLVPLLWLASYRGLAGLGPVRRVVAMLLRTAMVVLLVLAAAELQWVRKSDRLTVIYLLDQSLSIPAASRTAMIEYVNAAVARHRQRDDQVGVIVFGREASIEIPPFDESVRIPTPLESQLDPEYTNLAGAMRLAQASFPEESARRVVVVSDGNENLGNVLEQAQGATGSGIAIDVVPIIYRARAEVAVDKVTLPADIRKGEPFDVRVVLNNVIDPGVVDANEKNPGVVGGRLIISQRIDDQPTILSDQHVDVPPGKHVFTIRQEIDRPNFYSYEARFVPDNPAQDTMAQNNRATAFTHVRGSGQVLLVEDHEHRGEHDALVARLRKDNLEVSVRSSNQPFASLAELQQFDTVMLANVPREDFSDQQIAMLARNTQDLGGGLIMLGGPNSFGAGGWTNTEVEKALPVDCQIKSAKVIPKGALALVMHASEMPDGNRWQKVIAKEAIKALGNEDYCGVLHWNGNDQWLWSGGLKKVGTTRDQMLAHVERMVPGDMPDFDPSLVKAQKAFALLKDAAVKHMIVISDGDPAPPSAGVIRGLKALGVTVSTVAVGCHGRAESQVLRDLSTATQGKYYEVRDPQALPKIFQREARRVARPVIYENDNGFRPLLKFAHEMTSGIEGEMPPLTGFVMTTIKENPLVEVSIVSPVPGIPENCTILASWTYGLGKAVAFTSDAGTRWGADWLKWANYEKLFTQMVRWSMRPVNDQGKFTVSTEVADGQVKVFVTALDKNDDFLNFLDFQGAVIGPDMKSQTLTLKQTAPGRYVGGFPTSDTGSYFLMLSPGADKGSIRTGINVPYSPEFGDRESDPALLASMAQMTVKDGPAGVIIEDKTGKLTSPGLLAANSFRHDLPQAASVRDVWPNVLLIAGCVFFFDVLTRRVSLSLAWLPPLASGMSARLLRRERPAAPSEYLERLRSRKTEVTQGIEQQRAAKQFEPQADPKSDRPEALPNADVLESRQPPAGQPPASGVAPDKPEEESYTSRLLKAKKKAWEDRDKNRPSPPPE
jgi:uncharacterized membrane protein/Mg-chelatase subunit ChlD